jgi:acetolactate synthase-1/2/3 large subunit
MGTEALRSDPRRTKIVATLGPASSSKEAISALVRAGMDAARLNFSHGSHEQHAEWARVVREVQRATRPDATVVTGAGLPQGMVKQRWVTRAPRTHITSGGFSSMGFTLPAAIGARLAAPHRETLAICGDGDFLQSMQELATAVMLDVPVCTVVLDNSGWISIKGGQDTFFGRTTLTDFRTPDGATYSPDYAAIGRSFGIHAEHVTDPSQVCAAVQRALTSGGPSLVAITVSRELAEAGPDKTGWWDVPVSEDHADRRAEQLAGRAEEQHR